MKTSKISTSIIAATVVGLAVIVPAFFQSGFFNGSSFSKSSFIGPEVILALFGIAAIGYSLFSLIPSALIFFIGRPTINSNAGFGWTYLGTLAGGVLFGGLLYAWNMFTGVDLGIINFDFAIFTWAGIGMICGGIFGVAYNRKKTE